MREEGEGGLGGRGRLVCEAVANEIRGRAGLGTKMNRRESPHLS